MWTPIRGYRRGQPGRIQKKASRSYRMKQIQHASRKRNRKRSH